MVNGTKDPLRWSKHANIVKTPMSVQNSAWLIDLYQSSKEAGSL